MTKSYSASDTVGAIARREPRATRVFMEHDIDFCCGGDRPLDEACREKGLDTARVLDEIDRAARDANSGQVDWTRRPLIELIGHIMEVYHRPLRDELRTLMELAQKVLEAHGDRHGDTLRELRDLLQEFRVDLLSHLDKEEQVLFPAVLSGEMRSASQPVHALEQEHRDAARHLERIRELTNRFQVPADACNTWMAYWDALERLDRDLRQHIHLENNILFPRAMAA